MDGRTSRSGTGLAVDARGVCRRYGRNWALAGVDLQVPAGSWLLVAGANGSGKSTLLRVLAGALRCDAGEVRVAGLSGRDDLRRMTALLGHHAYTYEPLSALQNLQIFARLLGKPSRPSDLEPLLAEVGLARRAADPLHSFSAGMRKRLSLARVLLQEPKVLLLDEPYGQLDPPGFELLERTVSNLRAKGAAVVMASHLLERGSALCDRAIVLSRGRIAWSGHPSKVGDAFSLGASPALTAEAPCS